MTLAVNLANHANFIDSNGQLSASAGLVGTVAIANGGTNATTAANARTNLDVPSRAGSGASGTWGINVTGNAGSATNLANGAAFQVPYQSGSGATVFLPAPTVADTGIVWNGSSLAWGPVNGAVATGAMYENSQTITANYTITSGKNAMSAGPITIDTGVTVTVPTDSNWVIV